jgi:hypothetical protein
MCLELREFCLRYDLDFPLFEEVKVNNCYYYNVHWYSNTIYTSTYFSDPNNSIQDCILFLSRWCKVEANILSLLSKFREKDTIMN